MEGRFHDVRRPAPRPEAASEGAGAVAGDVEMMAVMETIRCPDRPSERRNETDERRTEMNEQQNPMGKIIAKALQDDAFKQQLIADPAAALKAEGVTVPEGITLKVVQDTESVKHLVLPAVGAGELSDEDLDAVAGGEDRCRKVRRIDRFLA